MLDVMTQMTRGVAYLHSRDVVHRDVKPANTLVHHADPLHVKLSDFDLCKFLGDADTSRLSTDVGTTAFKAPEFFLRNADMQISYHRFSCSLVSLRFHWMKALALEHTAVNGSDTTHKPNKHQSTCRHCAGNHKCHFVSFSDMW